MQNSDPTRPTHYVGIGASAGGLEAIEAFFTNMPANSGLAFIVVQHLSPDYKSMMVELLSKKTEMGVYRAENGMIVKANCLYLIPPKKNLSIFHGELVLKDQTGGRDRGINLPIDIFLRSLAEDQAEKAIAIILSGTGSDGTRGVRAVKEYGGMVMVQNEGSAKFDGMPRAAASTGVADFILTPHEMPAQLKAYVKHPYVSREKRSDTLLSDEDGLTRIFSELREKTKVDFTYYKPSTITRRIERRMTVNQMNELKEYVAFLESHPGEVITLYRELLIGVTSFFRDPDAMGELREKHLPALLKQHERGEIRFWVSGCSTGEEAYTIAILAKEVIDELKIHPNLKIFATDIDRDAIMAAGQGIYPESITADLTPRLLGKYFIPREENYQIARQIREMVVFAQHNLVKDPPFTKTHLVSCRNLLIYLQPVLQHKALEMFNFSLNADGILFLGSSETVGEMTDYFEVLHQKFKIYRCRGKARTPQTEMSGEPPNSRFKMDAYTPFRHPDKYRAPRENPMIMRYLELLGGGYIPLSLIVNEQMEIAHIIGNTEGFLKVPSGQALYDINKMASRDLAIPLATGLHRVFRTGKEMTYSNIPIKHLGESKSIRLRILPLPGKKGQEPFATVFFEEIEKRPSEAPEAEETYDVGAEAQQRIRDLEQEVQFARENLQATIEELETSNEELQATNEELLASNEELQSTNEELQSTNEELYTVNSEYQNKINELTELNNDFDNLLTSSRIGNLFLDENLDIRKYSPEIANIFNIMEKDIGRPLSHLSHKLVGFDPLKAARKVLKHEETLERELQTKNGKWYLARILPYYIAPKVYSGVLMTFVDITELQLARDNLTDSRQTYKDMIEYMPAGFFVYGLNEKGQLILETSNPEAERITGISRHEWKGKPLEEIWPEAKEKGMLDRFLKVLEGGEACYLDGLEYTDKKNGGNFRVCAFPLPGNRLAVSFEKIAKQ